jgi:hypothetical protein
VECSRACPPYRPRDDGIDHPADTARSNLAETLALLLRWLYRRAGFRFSAVPVECSRACPPHRPREHGLTHPADTPRSHLAEALALVSWWLYRRAGFRFSAVPVECSRACPPYRPRDDGIDHPADTARSNLAETLALLSRWLYRRAGFRFSAVPVECSRACPPHRPRDDGIDHPADTPRSHLAEALALVSKP